MKKYCLVTTDHLEDRLWFRDDEDYAAGMNYVAILSSGREVAVLAFILMSNHVHFVLFADEEEARAFIYSFKGRYAQYLNRKYGVDDFLRRVKVDIRDLSLDTEGVEKGIAYTQMNCVAAQICLHPSQYPWGTGNSFFNAASGHGKRLGDLSVRARRRLLHTDHTDLPENWLVSEAGYILPESYVDVARVERLFRKPSRMDYFLRNSSKAKKRLEASDENLPAFRDQVILGALPDLIQSLFHKKHFEELTSVERMELLRQLRFRFSAGPNQMARVCGLTYAEAAYLLNDV